MQLVGLVITVSLSSVLYEVGTHRRMGYWAVERSSVLEPALNRLEWDLPETTFGGLRLGALNFDLTTLREPWVWDSRPQDLIAAGCVTEDAYLRFLNHFCDGVNGGGFGISFASQIWGSTEVSNAFNWEQARSHYVSSLLEQDPDDREGHRVDLFRSLGQVLHLIQDAHQPSHTRNDSHSHIAPTWLPVLDGYSALELWAADAVSMDGSSLDSTVATAVRNLGAPIYRQGLMEYTRTSIRESARQTNREFYSDNTIWQNGPTYANPNGTETYVGTEGTFPFTQTYVFASAALHNTLSPLKMARRKSGLLDLLGGVGEPLDPRPYTLLATNAEVVRHHASTLIPRAVSECAGAINHFFRLGIEADIDTTTQPGEGRLKLTNVSSVPGASAADLTVAGGATVELRYETVSGRVLPLPSIGTLTLGAMPPNPAGVTLPVNVLGVLQPLANPVTYPDPNVRARTDLRLTVVVQGTVGQELAVGADLWSKPGCPDGWPTPAGTVAIPSGSFQMGSNAASGPPYYGGSATQPVHPVTISYCYWMGQHEVTQAEYAALMGTNPSYFPGANKPVERVSWFNAQAYCVALTAQQSTLGNVPPGYQYRLPTEAEWEYACRAGTTTEFNVGSALFCNQAKFDYSYHSNSYCSSNSTVPAGSYAPNAWGLHDMHGNVWEWCLDSYAAYGGAPVTDPFVTGGPYRVFRGGSWYYFSSSCRSASRSNHDPGNTNYGVGFRVVLAPVLVP